MNEDEKIKIFLVDDDLMFIESLKHALSEERAEITIFDNGEDCINHLNETPEIIILDYVFGNALNGVQVLNKIKHISPQTEVIMLSGIDNKSIMSDTAKYGAYDFIEKGESAIWKIKNKVKQLCDEIESANNAQKENHKIVIINAVVIFFVVVLFLLTRIK